MTGCAADGPGIRERVLSKVRIATVAADEAGSRLDRWVRRHFPAVSHGQVEKLLRTGQLRVDGKRVKAGFRLQPGQELRLPPNLQWSAAGERLPPRVSPLSEVDREALERAVLYRDASVIVLDKPAGLAVQGGSGQTRHLDAMLDALRFGADERPRLVHRLDKDTSGVLLLARGAAVARALGAAFQGKTVRKLYWAAVVGRPKPDSGRIDLPLRKRGGRGGERMALDPEAGQTALTDYALLAGGRGGKATCWLALSPETGRTHQLRVHCALIGHPIVGDGKYGGEGAFPPRLGDGLSLHLHAREVALPHPAEGTTLRVSAPLPPHMAATWRRLGWNRDEGEAASDRFIERLESRPRPT